MGIVELLNVSLLCYGLHTFFRRWNFIKSENLANDSKSGATEICQKGNVVWHGMTWMKAAERGSVVIVPTVCSQYQE